MAILGYRKCNAIMAVALLCWLSNLDGFPPFQQSSDLVKFDGGFIGGVIGSLGIILIGLVFKGIAWFYYQITKDNIDNEEGKTSFLKAK